LNNPGLVFGGTKKITIEAVKKINRQALINRNLNANSIHGTSFNVPKGVRFIGKYDGYGFSIWGGYDIYNQWDQSRISTGQLIVEQISNGIDAVPVYGTAWSIGWELGKKYGPSKWYGDDDTKWFK
jgi:hypothetical protein